ncbi:hypothetical protein Cgig2_015457 [Carnegiea gigantea]|uniref:Ubiquitin-like protease family profile domain-containing protein n=1 Tax=Carnegiea gigantea TaxID=171969 RepID=A0A9Q1JY74_9CARY|nr:hypothetical protein Cgig2_015457 [Carnegiea gigantea]
MYKERLFKYDHEEEDKRLWIFMEGLETMAGKDQDIESPIVDVLCLILNWMERRRNPSTPKRMFFSTNVYMALEKGSTDLTKTFKTVLGLERERYSRMKLDESQLNEGHKKGTNLKKFSLAFWKLSWQDDTNIHDCGIYTIRHMETFRGGQVENWRLGFELNKSLSQHLIFCTVANIETPHMLVKQQAPTGRIYNTPYAT